MNKVNHKQVLKDALDWIKQTYLSNPNELIDLNGICKAVEYYHQKVKRINANAGDVVQRNLFVLIKSWPHCLTYDFKDESGEYVRNTSFPVTSHLEWDDERNNGTIWHNLKRLELLEYLIQEVNKDE